MMEGKSVLRDVDDFLDLFAVDPDVFDNQLMKYQLFGLRFFGYIYGKNDPFRFFHFARGVLVTLSLFAMVSAQAVGVWTFRDNFHIMSLALGYFAMCSNIFTKAIAFHWNRKGRLHRMILLEILVCGFATAYLGLVARVHAGLKDIRYTSLPHEIKIQKHYIKYITSLDCILGVPLIIVLFLIWAEGLYFLLVQLEPWTEQLETANVTVRMAHIFDMYPFRHFSSNFIISFVCPYFMSIAAIFSLFIWHTLNASLMRYASFRLDILCHKIENMMIYIYYPPFSMDPNQRKCSAERGKVLRCIFISCVKDFADIKSFIRRYAGASNAVVFIESSTMSLLLCVELYILSLDLLAGYGIYQLWFFTTVGVLWLYYWHSNEISLKSNEITNALYSFPWYECSLSFQKDLAIFMQITNKPIVIQIGFIRMNVESLVMILKTSYSYFTLLKNVTN